MRMPPKGAELLTGVPAPPVDDDDMKEKLLPPLELLPWSRGNRSTPGRFGCCQ